MVSVNADPMAQPATTRPGAQQIQVGELSARLAREGHDVTVYTRQTDPAAPERVQAEGGYTIVRVPAGPLRALGRCEAGPPLGQFAGALRDAWCGWPPDLVHAHFWLSGLAAVLAAGATPVPVVQTFYTLGAAARRGHDSSPPERVSLERMLGRRVAAVVASCTDDVSELLRIGVPRARITVVPHGVDVDAFQDIGPVAPRSACPRVLAVGNLAPHQGFDTAIAALPGVPEAELLIAGSPATSDLATDPEAIRLRHCAAACGVTDRVRLLGGVARTDLPALLRSADVLVCTPRCAPSGVEAVEAMACGVPVVATAVGGLSDAVVDGVTGLQVPLGRPQSVQRALHTVLANLGLRAALGSAGRDRARSRYSWPSVAAEILRLYGRVLTRHTESAALAPQTASTG